MKCKNCGAEIAGEKCEYCLGLSNKEKVKTIDLSNKDLETCNEIMKNKGLVFCENCKYKRAYDYDDEVDCVNENNIIRTNKALKIKTEYQPVEFVNKNNNCKYYEKKIYFCQKGNFWLKFLIIIGFSGFIILSILKGCCG